MCINKNWFALLNAFLFWRAFCFEKYSIVWIAWTASKSEWNVSKVLILKCSQNGIILPFQKFEYDTSWIIEEINYNPCNESERLYNYCKRRNASGLLITCYDYIGVEKFAARWSATKCEISTLNSPSCCHQLVQQLIIIG